MRTNNILGVIYANVHDDLLPELAAQRSMASLPFAGRYRLVDFSLSNLVNAGISQVGIITKQNYQSLMDHVSNGKAWDLDRKAGGLFILPPFASTDSHGEVYRGHLDALSGIMAFLCRAKQEYVILCDSDVVSNIDIAKMFRRHLETGADFTVAYKHGKLPNNFSDVMSMEFDDDGRVNKIRFPSESESSDYSLDITITRREFLINLVNAARKNGDTSLNQDIFAPGVSEYKIYGYKVGGFAEVMDSNRTYYDLNMKMLDPRVRKQVFNQERPVYTKSHDCMPTRYGLHSVADNSLIADGCHIDGTVRNCVLFRNVTVEAGAVVENSILMQNCVIKSGANVQYAILDKSTGVSENVTVHGSKQKARYIRKGKKVEVDYQ